MGAINDSVMMENILASGKADVIYITGGQFTKAITLCWIAE